MADPDANIEVNNAVVENIGDDVGGHEILEEENVDNDIQGDHPLVLSVIVPSCGGKTYPRYSPSDDGQGTQKDNPKFRRVHVVLTLTTVDMSVRRSYSSCQKF